MSERLNNFFNSLKTNFSNIKNTKLFKIIVVIVAIIGICLIIWGGKFTNKSSTKHTSIIDEYVYNLEEKLTDTLSHIEGAGKVKVLITVESGMETVLAMKTTINETTNGREIIETPILVNGKTVVVKELFPEIIGVLIVAEGASNLSVMNKLQQATVSLLDIGVNQIEILSMK